MKRTPRRSLSSATIAAYYEYVSMLLNVDRYPLPPDAPAEAAAAARALAKLPAAALYRNPHGTVTPRPAIANEDTERAIAALGASVERDEALPADVRALAAVAVMDHWRGHAGGETSTASSVQRFVAELLNTRFVSDATFASALDSLGERGLVNLMVYMGYSNIRCAQQALAGSDCALITTRRGNL